MSLYNNLHIICHFNKNKNYSYIESLANINNNKYYKCIEFFNINDRFKLGINLKCQKYNKFYIYKINKTNRIINGDFLEKYLTLFLKLKATISGVNFFILKIYFIILII